jgi:hypothetical protein
VYLSGIGVAAGDAFSVSERLFLRRLDRAVPEADVVDDIFPYSVSNRPLTGQRTFARLWRWALRQKLEGPALAGSLINVRNAWQVAVASDSRYAPLYHRGSAQVILDGLRRHGYRLGSGKPVVFVGHSGGVQVAIGAAPFIQRKLAAPVYVVSLGGVFNADPGLDAVAHLWHLYGSKDWVHVLGTVLFPGRWGILPYSPWNRLRARGALSVRCIGPIKHTGKGGYLDHRTLLPNGKSCMEHTIDVIANLIRPLMGDTPPTPASATRTLHRA